MSLYWQEFNLILTKLKNMQNLLLFNSNFRDNRFAFLHHAVQDLLRDL